jgi:hypothetical protein
LNEPPPDRRRFFLNNRDEDRNMSVALEIAGSAVPNTVVDYDNLPKYKLWELGRISVHDLLPEELDSILQERAAALGGTSLRLVETIV